MYVSQSVFFLPTAQVCPGVQGVPPNQRQVRSLHLPLLATAVREHHQPRGHRSVITPSIHPQPVTHIFRRVPVLCCVHFPPFSLRLFVLVVRLDGSQPVRYCLKQRMEDRYHNLREQLSQMASIHCNHFILVDVYGGTIRVSHGYTCTQQVPPPLSMSEGVILVSFPPSLPPFPSFTLSLCACAFRTSRRTR